MQTNDSLKAAQAMEAMVLRQLIDASGIFTAKVARVHDGDTLTLDVPWGGQDNVRLIGYDAPEVPSAKDPMPLGHPLGVQAGNTLRGQLEGKLVRYEPDQTVRDAYDRLLGYLFLDSRLINQGMLEEGWGRAYLIGQNMKYATPFCAAECGARKAKKNIWAAVDMQGKPLFTSSCPAASCP